MNNTPKILVVDDSEDSVFLTERLLRSTGFTPPFLVAKGGMEAIELLGSNASDVDLVLLDIRMPRCDGFDVLEWIRAHSGLHQLLVVMLSTSDEERDVSRARERGANGYVVKYPSTWELSEVLAQIAPQFGAPPAKPARTRASRPTRESAWPFPTR